MASNKLSKFQEKIQELKEFIKKNGRLPKSTENNTLCCWLYQRASKDNLTEAAFVKQHTGLDVEDRRMRKKKTYDFIHELKEFIEKNGRLPFNTENKSLCNWLKRNAEKENLTEPAFVKQHTGLDVQERRMRKNKTSDFIHELKEFIEKNKRLPKSTESNALFQWLKYNAEKEKLTEPAFVKKHTGLDVEDRRSKQNLQELKEFVEKNKRLPKYAENVALCQWLKRNAEKENLTEAQFVKMHTGFDVQERKHFISYEQRMQELKEFVGKNKQLPSSSNEQSLYEWLKRNAEKEKLTEPAFVKKHTGLDVEDRKKTTYEQRVEEVKKHVEKYKSFIRKDNVTLYNWAHNQSKKKKFPSVGNFINHITGLTVKQGRQGPKNFHEKRIQELKEFIKKNKRLPNTSYNEKSFYEWLKRNAERENLTEAAFVKQHTGLDVEERRMQKKKTSEENILEVQQEWVDVPSAIDDNNLLKNNEKIQSSKNKQTKTKGKDDESKGGDETDIEEIEKEDDESKGGDETDIEEIEKEDENFNINSTIFKTRIQELKDFIKKNHQLPTYRQNSGLHRWLKNTILKKTKLTEVEFVKKYTGLDVPKRKTLQTQPRTYEQNFSDIKNFIQKNNRLPLWMGKEQRYIRWLVKHARKKKLSKEEFVKIYMKIDLHLPQQENNLKIKLEEKEKIIQKLQQKIKKLENRLNRVNKLCRKFQKLVEDINKE
jgi:hypothetical protein